jgi:hypothetical protein
MKELLLCALKRHGKPATAGEIADAAIALAMAEGWPRRSWLVISAKSASGKLKEILRTGDVIRCAHGRLENSVERPLYEPIGGYDARAPLPQIPDSTGEDHPLHGKTLRQQFVIHDIGDMGLELRDRQYTELVESLMGVLQLIRKHSTEFAEYRARAKSRLFEVGLGDAR